MVQRDLSVRIDARSRAFLDQLIDRYDLGEAEVCRVLIASSIFDVPSRQRAALALYACGVEDAATSAAQFVDGLRADLARYAGKLVESRGVRVDRTLRVPPGGPKDRPKLRVRLESLLRKRVSYLSEILLRHLSGDPVSTRDPVVGRLLAWADTGVTGRSIDANVVRWATITEPIRNREQTEEILGLYLAMRSRMQSVIDDAFTAARERAAEAVVT